MLNENFHVLVSFYRYAALFSLLYYAVLSVYRTEHFKKEEEDAFNLNYSDFNITVITDRWQHYLRYNNVKLVGRSSILIYCLDESIFFYRQQKNFKNFSYLFLKVNTIVK